MRVVDEDGMWVKELDKYESSVLTMMQMKDCMHPTSPKLEKQTEPGDDDPCEQPELYRSAVCTILYMTKRRPDLQATARWQGQNGEIHPGFEILGNFHAKRASNPDSIEAYLDGDWAFDDTGKKSASEGYLIVGGCRQQDDWTTCAQQR